MTTRVSQGAPAGHFRAFYHCSSGCPGEFPLSEVIYRCPRCQGLLEVGHDVAVLKATAPADWKRILDERSVCRAGLYASGVWAAKEIVCPEVSEQNIVSTGEGRTPLCPADRLARRWGLSSLQIKQCGSGHTGSFKDLGMTVLVSVVNDLRRRGKTIPAVACASTGDTSAALAAYCALAGIPAIVLLPKDKISTAQLMQPLAHGAVTIAVDGDFDTCMRIVQEITGRDGIYLANSMNPLRIEGQKTVGIELCQQLGWQVPDLVVIPGGNLGNVSALGEGFLLMQRLGIIDRLPRIACAQAENANPLYLSYLQGFKHFAPVVAKATLASAIQIGNPVSFSKAVRVLRQFEGIVEQASEGELAEAAAEADRAGLYCCPQTGVALAALQKLVRRGEIRPEGRVVVISTAHGLKFSAFKAGYHRSPAAGGGGRRYANAPIEVEASYEKVHDAVFRVLDSR